jgi:hypothetical protein
MGTAMFFGKVRAEADSHCEVGLKISVAQLTELFQSCWCLLCDRGGIEWQ